MRNEYVKENWGVNRVSEFSTIILFIYIYALILYLSYLALILLIKSASSLRRGLKFLVFYPHPPKNVICPVFWLSKMGSPDMLLQ
jgi:hypothetical protein